MHVYMHKYASQKVAFDSWVPKSLTDEKFDACFLVKIITIGKVYLGWAN